jgi:hypothetical protein
LRHLVDTVSGLADRGIGFRSLQEAIDTTTPGGKLVFHVFAALAEFERDLIRERTAAGLAAARARGRHGGRPTVLTAHKLQVARELYGSGQYTVATIAKTWGSAAPRSTGTSLTPTATNLTVRPKPWTLPCECALKEVRSPGESVERAADLGVCCLLLSVRFHMRPPMRPRHPARHLWPSAPG